jgi:poly(beta-D-mannuronate) lyase
MKNITHFKNLGGLAVTFLITFNLYSQTTHNISDPEDLTALSASLGAGDTVILADGVYTTDERIKFSPTTGTAAMPITFKAETPGEVVFTGGLQMSIGGDHVIVDGFYWQGGYGSSKVIEFRDGTDYANNSTIQNCAMDGLTVHPDDIEVGTSVKHNWIHMYGTYNTVINCSFMNKTNAGNMILIDLSYNVANSCDEVGHSISNNYFYNFEKIDSGLTNAGDSETIRIGTSSNQMVNSSARVTNNYFYKADGENEIITNKSKNNTYSNNTFRKSRGSLVLRHGSHATVDGNYFLGENEDGTGGIRIVDREHTITNNYIQDCITVIDQAKWNNGITFLGGSTTSAYTCESSNSSSGYQKVENINLSNNTIINTNAPLYYNTDKGSTDPTGTVSNNLIYFTAGNANITDIITGDTPTSYADLGTALTYSGNVYTGTTLGETNVGFSLENGITATPYGEIFTFSGTGSSGKGADMGAYTPTTDDMVGYEIGACFLNNLGVKITDGDCTIMIPKSLTVSSLSTLSSDAASYDVSVSANVSWTALSNNGWISINTDFGAGDETVSVSVTENTDINSRAGSVTFTQDPGGDDIVRVLNITQNGIELTDLYDLINTGLKDDPVIIHSFSKEEVNGVDKFNYAANTLDKDNNSVWAADDGGAILSGDYKGDGEYIIYDLGSIHNLDLVQFSTTSKSDAFGFQVWVSTTGTEVSDFTMALPTTGDLLLTATNTTDFNQYEFTANARYLKLLGFGRFNNAGDTRVSVWSAVGEIEFYGTLALSVEDNEFKNKVVLFPIPTSDMLFLKNINGVKLVTIYAMDGKKVLEKFLDSSSETSINVSSLSNGAYIVNLINEKQKKQSKMIIISK